MKMYQVFHIVREELLIQINLKPDQDIMNRIDFNKEDHRRNTIMIGNMTWIRVDQINPVLSIEISLALDKDMMIHQDILNLQSIIKIIHLSGH